MYVQAWFSVLTGFIKFLLKIDWVFPFLLYTFLLWKDRSDTPVFVVNIFEFLHWRDFLRHVSIFDKTFWQVESEVFFIGESRGYCKGVCGYKIVCPNICINAGWRKWSMRENIVWYTVVILYCNYLVDKKSKVPWSYSNPVTGVGKSSQGTFSVSFYLFFLNS